LKLRVVAVTVCLALVGALFVTSSAASGQQAPTDAFNIRGTTGCMVNNVTTTCLVDVTRFRRVGNDVMMRGTVTPASVGQAVPFTAPLPSAPTTGAGPMGESLVLQQTPGPSCDILNLVLGPLHLDLLGLVIDLNQVILNITGATGAGNLLGNLLCGLFGVLGGLAGLAQFLTTLQNLLSLINQILML